MLTKDQRTILQTRSCSILNKEEIQPPLTAETVEMKSVPYWSSQGGGYQRWSWMEARSSLPERDSKLGSSASPFPTEEKKLSPSEVCGCLKLRERATDLILGFTESTPTGEGLWRREDAKRDVREGSSSVNELGRLGLKAAHDMRCLEQSQHITGQRSSNNISLQILSD